MLSIVMEANWAPLLTVLKCDIVPRVRRLLLLPPPLLVVGMAHQLRLLLLLTPDSVHVSIYIYH
jgi:hypothetical protein